MALSYFNPKTLETRPLSPPPEDATAAPLSPQSAPDTGEVLLDWDTQLYDFATGQVAPKYTPLAQQFEAFQQHLLGELAALQQRLDLLEATLIPPRTS